MYKIKFHKLGSSFMHYGRLGQKRGVRNYQNYDGSLTELGRIHYGVGEPRGSKGGTEVLTNDAHYSTGANASKGRQIKEGSDYNRSGAQLAKIKKGPNGELSEEDINTRANELTYIGNQLNRSYLNGQTEGTKEYNELRKRCSGDPETEELELMEMWDDGRVPDGKGGYTDYIDFIKDYNKNAYSKYEQAAKDISDALIPKEMREEIGDQDCQLIAEGWSNYEIDGGVLSSKSTKNEYWTMAEVTWEGKDLPFSYRLTRRGVPIR